MFRKTNKNRKSNTIIACVAAMAVSATTIGNPNVLLAQQESTQDKQAATQQDDSRNWTKTESRTASQTATVDHFLASKLILCNNGQIKAAQMIQERSNSEEVKAYARQIAEDHKGFNTMLQSMAAFDVQPTLLAAADSQSDETETSDSDRSQATFETSRRVAGSEVTDVTNPDTASNTRAVQETSMREVQPNQLESLFRVVHQAANIQQTQCKKMFSQYEGYELDMAYVGSQIMAHQMMKAELTAISETSDSQLKSVAEKGLDIVENHLQRATKLSEALEIMKSNGNYASQSSKQNNADHDTDKHHAQKDHDKQNHDKKLDKEKSDKDQDSGRDEQ